jgi:hypothetical protein
MMPQDAPGKVRSEIVLNNRRHFNVDDYQVFAAALRPYVPTNK